MINDTFIVTCFIGGASESHNSILNMLKNIFEMTAGTPDVLSYDNEIYPIPKKHHYKVVRRYTCVHRNNSKQDTVPCSIYGEAMDTRSKSIKMVSQSLYSAEHSMQL